MTRKEGLSLRPGIYKVFWKRGGWSWVAIGALFTKADGSPLSGKFAMRGLMAFDHVEHPGFYEFANGYWRKIAKVERAPLAKIKGER